MEGPNAVDEIDEVQGEREWNYKIFSETEE